MNLENPSTLERHDEPLPSYQGTEPPSTGKPRRHGWIWLLVLILVGVGVYYYLRSHSNPATAAPSAAQSPGGSPGRGAGAIPVVAARARKGDIGVYVTGLG